MSEPVKLSRERWEMLRASWEWPIIGMYSDGSRFINVLEPRETCGITFLPATYVPDEDIWVTRSGVYRVTKEIHDEHGAA